MTTLIKTTPDKKIKPTKKPRGLLNRYEARETSGIFGIRVKTITINLCEDWIFTLTLNIILCDYDRRVHSEKSCPDMQFCITR